MGMSASQARLLSLTARLSDTEYAAQKLMNAKMRLTSQTEQVGKDYNEALDKKKFVNLTGYNKSAPVYADVTANRLTNYNPDSIDAQKILTDMYGRVMVSGAMSQNYYNALLGNTQDGKTNIPAAFADFLKTYGLAKDQATADLFNATHPNSAQLTYNPEKVQYYRNIFDASQSAGGCFSPDKEEYMNDSEWIYNQLKNGSLYIKEWKSDSNQGKGAFEEISWQTGDSGLQEVADDSGNQAAKAEYDHKMSQIQSSDKKYDLEIKQLDTEHNALQTEYDSVKKVMDKNIESSFKSFG